MSRPTTIVVIDRVQRVHDLSEQGMSKRKAFAAVADADNVDTDNLRKRAYKKWEPVIRKYDGDVEAASAIVGPYGIRNSDLMAGLKLEHLVAGGEYGAVDFELE